MGARPSPAADDRGPSDPESRHHVLGRREHSLLSLVELNRRLGRSLDAHGAAEALLLNLMGQLGTSRAALWLSSGSEDGKPVLVRCHGIEPESARALAASCWADLQGRFRSDPRPIPPAEVRGSIGHAVEKLASQSRVEVLAPLSADNELLGLVALGPPLGGRAYEPLDFEVLEASLAIAGVAIRNANLSARVLETNRRLRVALEELHELDRPKSEFISNVNHELRTPLTVVLASLDCLSQGTVGSEASRQLVASATRSAQGLLALVEKLLTFSTASRDGLRLNVVESDLQPFLEAYHRERQPGVSAGLRELHFECHAAPLRARFDAQRLRQVLDELVDNAVKFTPQGSNIRLGLSGHVEDKLAWARIGVRDDGRGIPPQRMGDLFKEFVQLDGSMTREAGGLGLGLAAARKMVEAMGGRLTASSEPGRGAAFFLLLPAI